MDFGFLWSKIRNISFNDCKFVIKPIDKKAPDYSSFSLRTCASTFWLCVWATTSCTSAQRKDGETRRLQEEVEDARWRQEDTAAALITATTTPQHQHVNEEDHVRVRQIALFSFVLFF